MKVLLVCRYCNYSWERNMYMGSGIEEKCSKCGDTSIDVKELDKTKIDAYQGCPPFPEKKKEHKVILDFPYWSGD